MSGFSDNFAPTNYNGYSIYLLLCSYWKTWERLITIRELINIDNRNYDSEIRFDHQKIFGIATVLQDKWISRLPPLFMIFVKYSKHKIIYNPKRFEKKQYFS